MKSFAKSETTFDVDNTKMDDIILGLNNDLDSIDKILNDIKMDFYDMKEYFKGDVADTVQEKWSYYDSSISRVKDNLKSYCDDMIQVKLLYSKIDQNSAQTINEFSDAIQKRTNDKLEDNTIQNNQIYINSGNANDNIK